jgi:hypothetical protein
MNHSLPEIRPPIEKPNHPLPRKYVEPILFLAERMASMERVQPPPPQRMVDALAETVGQAGFRRERWFRELNDNRACERIDLETAKKGALVVLSLVLKADTNRGEEARAYFSKIRALLGAEPITVPADLADHKELTLKYLRS